MGRVNPPGSMGCVPFPVHLVGQSVLCALGSSPRLWLSSFNCGVPVPVKTHQQQCVVLGVISFRADPRVPPDIDSFCFASVFTSARVFWVTASAQGSPLSPCSHSGSGQRDLLSFSHPYSRPRSEAWPDSERTLLLPLPGFHQPGMPLSFSSDSCPLTCAFLDLWVLQCLCTCSKRTYPARCISSSNWQSPEKLPDINTVNCIFSLLLSKPNHLGQS